MFDIRFIRDEPEPLDEWLGEGAIGLRGRVVIDDLREEFLAQLGVWRREDYERHWREAAERIVAGADRTVFFTSAFEFRWTMWRVGDTLRLREHYLSSPGFPERFDPADIYAHIQDYVPGEPVSEWTIPADSAAEFLRRAAVAGD